jgi:hypothetical protein
LHPLLPWLLLFPFPESATLTYRKIFKDSTPEFTEIKIREDGKGTYEIRQLDEPADAQPFEVSPQLAAKMFELARELNHFRDTQLDVQRRVANLGQKTFRYERGKEAYEASFNYTVHPVANQLLQIFEGLARQQGHLVTLERRMRYDRLGVHEALLRFEADLNRKLIPEPEQLLPALEAIANDPHYLEIARQRARALIQRIRVAR